MPDPGSGSPFGTGDPIGRNLFEAYLAGRCGPEERHAVERALEADPKLREAMERSRMMDERHGSDALPGYPDARPRMPRARLFPAISAIILVAGTWLVISPLMDRPDTVTIDRPLRLPQLNSGPATGALPPMDVEEIEATTEQPPGDQIGHARDERHTEAMHGTVEPTAIERIGPRASNTVEEKTRPGPRTEADHSSRQLVFLHGHKLVHPAELYPFDPKVYDWQGHTPAANVNEAGHKAANGSVRTLDYLSFMAEAIALFSAHDHKGSLLKLHFLLEQYPNDVNALFYAGLCAHNLGAFPRAEELLGRAATHRVNTFEEEARWYQALTLERMGAHAEARAAFARIAAEGGFYADRAAQR